LTAGTATSSGITAPGDCSSGGTEFDSDTNATASKSRKRVAGPAYEPSDKRRLEAANAPTIKFDRKTEPGNQAAHDQSRWLLPDELLFHAPDKLMKIFNRDLEVVGIPKRDDRGRTIDVHGAVEALPTLSLTATQKDAPEVMRATGTMGMTNLDTANSLGPDLGPTSGKPCQFTACIGTESEQMGKGVSKRKTPKTKAFPHHFRG